MVNHERLSPNQSGSYNTYRGIEHVTHGNQRYRRRRSRDTVESLGAGRSIVE